VINTLTLMATPDAAGGGISVLILQIGLFAAVIYFLIILLLSWMFYRVMTLDEE